MPENTVILESKDGRKFNVPLKQAEMSTTIRDMLLYSDGEGKKTAPLSLVSGDTLEKVVEWLQKHEGDAPQTPEVIADCTVVDSWDREFFSAMDLEKHMAVVRAACFLNIQRLKDNGCKLLTTMMQGLTLEETRKKFGIEGPIPEEEDFDEQNDWLD